MPTYKITDPSTGKSISLTGDSPPSEAELNDIFSKVHGQTEQRYAQPGAETMLTNLPTKGVLANVARYSPAVAAGMAGAAEGGTMGAAAGTAILPGVGTAVGGALGALGGAAIGGFSGEAARQGAAAAYSAAKPEKQYPQLTQTQLIQALNRQAKEQAINEATGQVIKGAMPLVKSAARGVGKAAESISGLEYKTPGVLEDVAKDPSLLFGPGKEEAGKAYELIKDDLQVRPAMLEATNHGEIIELGKYALEKGDLTPQEALIARRALDEKWSGIPKTTANYLRPKFDAIAKTISADADEGFKRAIKSDALRTVLATNKLGGTSIAKLFLGGLTKYGSLGVASSPIVQGTAAASAGMAGRAIEASPYATSAAARALLERRKKDYGTP